VVICIAEDRKSHESSLKLLLLSLTRHCPDFGIILFYPAADEKFILWLSRCPQVSLRATSAGDLGQYNIKPQALLSLLQAGYDDVVWMDSDIIVTRDFRYLFTELTSRTVVLTEEAAIDWDRDPDGLRARLWGFEIGRVFNITANTAVIRVTPDHIPLLEEWRRYLQTDIYNEAQRQVQRPIHLVGDQDVLTALLTSHAFSDVPVKLLKRGTDIIQYFGVAGYSTSDRLNHLVHGLPPLIHAQGYQKPWTWFGEPRKINSLRDYLVELYLDLSPHTMVALPYRPALDDVSLWMKPRFFTSAALRAAGLWYPPLVGLPITALFELRRLIKRTLRL
jgi:hypothetical protein